MSLLYCTGHTLQRYFEKSPAQLEKQQNGRFSAELTFLKGTQNVHLALTLTGTFTSVALPKRRFDPHQRCRKPLSVEWLRHSYWWSLRCQALPTSEICLSALRSQPGFLLTCLTWIKKSQSSLLKKPKGKPHRFLFSKKKALQKSGMS